MKIILVGKKKLLLWFYLGVFFFLINFSVFVLCGVWRVRVVYSILVVCMFVSVDFVSVEFWLYYVRVVNRR